MRLDPDNLPPSDIKAKFSSLLHEYDNVFDPNIGGYNGAAGPFEAKVNMGPVEPPSARAVQGLVASMLATSCWTSSTNMMSSKPWHSRVLEPVVPS